MSAINKLQIFLFLVLVTLGGFFGITVAWALLFPVFFLKHGIFRMAIDYAMGSWFNFVSGLLELFLGVKVKVTGDIMQPGERSLIIMNHRTRLDWMYFWSVLVRQSGTSTEKIILKSPLKTLPGFVFYKVTEDHHFKWSFEPLWICMYLGVPDWDRFSQVNSSKYAMDILTQNVYVLGWAMQVASFIFIERKWDEDKKIFAKLLDYFVAMKHKTQILLFPEGTDLTERTKTKSDEFARKNNVEPFNYVLHPRTTGFTFLTQYMRQREHLDVVYDVTIAYPQNIPQKEIELLAGNFPREVHFHIKRHVIQSLPITEEGLATWCKIRWEEKEQRLKKFYDHKAFEETDDNIPGSRVNGDSDNVLTEGVDQTDNSEYLRNLRVNKNRQARYTMQIMTLSWTIFIVIISALLYASSMARWLVLVEVCMFVLVTKKYGGFEFLQADYFNWFYSNNKKAKKIE